MRMERMRMRYIVDYYGVELLFLDLPVPSHTSRSANNINITATYLPIIATRITITLIL